MYVGPVVRRSAVPTWSLREYLEQWLTGEVAHVSPATVATTMDLHAHVTPAISRDGANVVAHTLVGPRP